MISGAVASLNMAVASGSPWLFPLGKTFPLHRQKEMNDSWYGKTGKGGGGSRRSEEIGLTHAHGEGGGVTYRYRGISALVRSTVKLVRGEEEEMKRSD